MIFGLGSGSVEASEVFRYERVNCIVGRVFLIKTKNLYTAEVTKTMHRAWQIHFPRETIWVL
jgi:hypothetical protein